MQGWQIHLDRFAIFVNAFGLRLRKTLFLFSLLCSPMESLPREFILCLCFQIFKSSQFSIKHDYYRRILPQSALTDEHEHQRLSNDGDAEERVQTSELDSFLRELSRSLVKVTFTTLFIWIFLLSGCFVKLFCLFVDV